MFVVVKKKGAGCCGCRLRRAGLLWLSNEDRSCCLVKRSGCCLSWELGCCFSRPLRAVVAQVRLGLFSFQGWADCCLLMGFGLWYFLKGVQGLSF